MYSALRQQTSEKHDHAMFKPKRMQQAEADAQPAQIIFQIKNLMFYCATDVLATYEVFQKLTIEFFNR